ncbi:MAG: DNA-binding protein [Synergistaceae bacterium]|nr:DNA-binding protein [Synergistaceae bacterium]
MSEIMQVDNSVTISGLLHHIRNGKKDGKYFLFSVKQETPWSDGTTRRDFLVSRAFLPEIQERVQALPEGTPLKVSGSLHSSLGSGELYVYAQGVEVLPA